MQGVIVVDGVPNLLASRVVTLAFTSAASGASLPREPSNPEKKPSCY